jgi:hypothetical protein
MVLPVFSQDYKGFLDQNPNDPYARGRQDFVDGKKITNCPLRTGSKESRKWKQGWYFQQDLERKKDG